MNNNISVLIADDNEDLAKELSSYIGAKPNMTVTAIAKEVFPDSPHQHFQAEAHKNVLSYYAYLDSHNRKVFCQWLDNKVIG